MQGLRLAPLVGLIPKPSCSLNFSRAADAGQIVLVRAVLGRQDCVPLGTLSVPAACSGRWAALVTECSCKGRFQEDADSSLICLWNSLYSSAFLGKNPSVSGGERLLWV